MKLFFIITAFLCGYSYFFYPLLLRWLPQRRSEAVEHARSPDDLPVLSLIITVHNEQDRIAER